MKKYMLIILLGACTLANAQKLVGIKGGLNISNLSNSYTNGMDDSKNLQTWHAGITSNLPFLFFSLQSSLLVSGKGAQVTYGEMNSPNYYVAKTNPMYLEVPITLNFNPRLGARTGLYFGAGPFVAMGFAGKNSVSGYRDGVYFEHNDKINFTNDDPTTANVEEGAAYGRLRRFDYGVTFDAGVILAGVLLGAYYDLGLRPINSMSNTNQNDNYTNRTLGFSAGFMFGGD